MDLDHPDWVTQYVMPRNPTQVVLWVFVWYMCKGSKTSKEEMPNLVWHCTQEMGKHLLRYWITKCSEGGLEALPKESGEEGKAVLCSNAPLCPLSDKCPRDCWDHCPNGKRFILSIFSSLLSPLGYEVPTCGLAKNVVRSVQSPEISSKNCNKMTNNSTSQKSN